MPRLYVFFGEKTLFLHEMKTRYKNRISRFMLASGLLLLLTVVIPHHHHEDGEVCIFMWDNGNADDEHDADEYLSCECNGHTIAFNPALHQKHASEPNDLTMLLIPLYTLFDYITPPLPFPLSKVSDSEKTLYAESLYSMWITVAAGFRAPPFF